MNSNPAQDIPCKLTGQLKLFAVFWSFLKPVLKPTHLHNNKSKTPTHLEQLKEIKDETARESRPPHRPVRPRCDHARPRCRCPVRWWRRRDVVL